MFRSLNFVEQLASQLGGFSLVGNKRLVDVKLLLVDHKGAAPFLPRLWHRVRRFNSDEEATLEIENQVDVKEDVVENIAAHDALLFKCLF